ncbi:MAG: hypothetical protein ACRDQB_04725, partial [Thermocrispum sp.]
MARRRRIQQPGTLTAREQARIQSAVTTALATIEPRRPDTDLVPVAPRATGEGRPRTRRVVDTPAADDERYRDRHGRLRDPGLRSLAHRNRRQLHPWRAMLATAATGYLTALLGWLTDTGHTVGWITGVAGATATVALLAALLVKRVHPYWSSWLTVCAATASAWVSFTAATGFSYPLLVALYAATCLLGLRWWRHVRHPYPQGPDAEPSDSGMDGARITQDWADNAGCPGGPVPGARLAKMQPYKHGYTGEIRLVRGKQSLGDIQAALPRLSTALDVAPGNLIVEAHPDGPPSRLRVQIVTRSPVTTAVLFDEPVYAEGRILLGPYADGLGQATFVLYSDDSIESGYVLGSKGSGKSRVLETVSLTAIAATPTVIFYIDGQNGASSPLLWHHALWHAGPDNAEAMLRALLSIKDYRQLYN